MVKIAYVVSTLKRTGPTNQLCSLIKHLDLEKYKPIVITLSAEPADSRWYDFEALGVDIYSLDLSRFQSLLKAKPSLELLIDRLQVDLIQSQGIRADALISKLNDSRPTISTLHNYPQLDYPKRYGYIIGNFMAAQHIKYLKDIKYCVGVSEAVCRNAETFLGFGKIMPIQNGVDAELFFPVDEKAKADLRKKLKHSLKNVIWVSTGHLSELKNPLFLIELWKNHFKKNTNIHLLFIGDGSLLKASKHASLEFENIHFAGRVADVAEYLQAADYFVSASTAEGLPNSVLEAMACGLPFLLSDIPPHREVWEFNKCAGRLFEVDNEESYLNAFTNLVSKDYEMLSGNAIKAINDQFNAKTMSKRYQELYRQVLSDKENKC